MDKEYRFYLISMRVPAGIELDHAPAGWDNIGKTYNRSEYYDSVMRSYTLSLRFPVASGYGGDFIKEELDLYGVYSDIKIIIRKKNHNTDDYYTWFEGKLDVSAESGVNQIIDVSGDYITCGCVEDSVLYKFSSRDEIEVDLFNNKSLDNVTINATSTEPVTFTRIDLYMGNSATMQTVDSEKIEISKQENEVNEKKIRIKEGVGSNDVLNEEWYSENDIGKNFDYTYKYNGSKTIWECELPLGTVSANSLISGEKFTISSYASGSKTKLHFNSPHGIEDNDILFISVSDITSPYYGYFIPKVLDKWNLIINAIYVSENTENWELEYNSKISQVVAECKKFYCEYNFYDILGGTATLRYELMLRMYDDDGESNFSQVWSKEYLLLQGQNEHSETITDAHTFIITQLGDLTRRVSQKLSLRARIVLYNKTGSFRFASHNMEFIVGADDTMKAGLLTLVHEETLLSPNVVTISKKEDENDFKLSKDSESIYENTNNTDSTVTLQINPISSLTNTKILPTSPLFDEHDDAYINFETGLKIYHLDAKDKEIAVHEISQEVQSNFSNGEEITIPYDSQTLNLELTVKPTEKINAQYFLRVPLTIYGKEYIQFINANCTSVILKESQRYVVVCNVISKGVDDEEIDCISQYSLINSTLARICSENNLLGTSSFSKLLYFIKGDRIRGFQNQHVVSFRNLFRSLSSIYCYGLGFNYSTNKFYLAPKSEFYKKELLFEFGEVSNFKESINAKAYFPQINTGYPKSSFERFNGTNEYNCSMSFSSPTQIKSTVDISSSFSASSVEAEFLRRYNITRYGKTDTRHDQTTYVFECEDIDGDKKIKQNGSGTTGFDGIEKFYNISISPRENLKRWLNYLLTTLHLYPSTKFFKFLSKDKQNIVQNSSLFGTGVKDIDDITTELVGKEEIFVPKFYDFDYIFTKEIQDAIELDPHRYYKFYIYGVAKYGEIEVVQTKENNDTAHYKLKAISIEESQDIILGTNSGYVYRLKSDGSNTWGGTYFSTKVTSLIIDSLGNICAGNYGIGSSFHAINPLSSYVIAYYPVPKVNCLALQSDGKILIGHSNGILRLNTDYSLDDTFGTDFGGYSISSILVLSDDTFWIGSNNATIDTLYYFDKDGQSPIISNIFSVSINCLAKQLDGKILAGTPQGAYRFNSDGSDDSSFTQYYTECVNSICIDFTNKIISAQNGDALILNLDGSYNSSISGSDPFNVVKMQSDGKLLFGESPSIIRHNADYSVDSSFSSSINSTVTAIALIN